ncbi:hypothetical protein K7T73_15895 [Bacillus badius]|uniref:hypothetical protein n=1 Tax=Bacillus badius TaxID=1455 RepID=UPI001CBB4A6F|nr:hypothetical protein [Bacillus badius]UAT30020.1 hypothetical protein K7T73_15895 [Bacillus badius]
MSAIQRKYEEMMQAYQQSQELPSSVTTVVRSVQELLGEEMREINSDGLLSEQGKQVERAKLRDKYGKAFLAEAKKLRDEYDKAVIKAQVSAEVLLNEEPPKSSDVSVKTFQRELEALKMDVLLGTDPEASAKAIEAFASKQTDPYLAKQLAGEFAGLANSVLSSANNDPQVKLKLRDAYGTISDKALLPEQKKAAEIAGYMQDSFGKPLFREQSIEMNAIEQTVGSKYTQYANKPHLFVETE